MIPEGLVLLISLAFAVSVLKLSSRKTLVQDMYCIETLARVDTLCLDKTGTITEGTMQVDSLLPFEGISEEDILNELCDGSFENVADTPFKGLQDREGKVVYIDCWSYDGRWIEEKYPPAGRRA